LPGRRCTRDRTVSAARWGTFSGNNRRRIPWDSAARTAVSWDSSHPRNPWQPARYWGESWGSNRRSTSTFVAATDHTSSETSNGSRRRGDKTPGLAQAPAIRSRQRRRPLSKRFASRFDDPWVCRPSCDRPREPALATSRLAPADYITVLHLATA